MARSTGPARPTSQRHCGVAGGVIALLVALCAGSARAAPEEIVVFDDEFEAPGEHGWDLHLNYVTRSRTEPDYAGEQAPNRVWRAMPELAIGLSPHWNLGIHVPLSHDRNTMQTHVDGFKVRLTQLFVRPLSSPGTSWFYGVNYELSRLARRLSDTKLVAELRGIVGWRNPEWLVSVNPILNRPASRSDDNHAVVSLDLFSRVMRTWGEDFALGAEHYAELGEARRPTFQTGSSQTTFAVMDIKLPGDYALHAGIGRGWRGGEDPVVFKAIVGLPF